MTKNPFPVLKVRGKILQGADLTKKETVKKSLLYDVLFTLEIAAENAEKTQK